MVVVCQDQVGGCGHWHEQKDGQRDGWMAVVPFWPRRQVAISLSRSNLSSLCFLSSSSYSRLMTDSRLDWLTASPLSCRCYYDVRIFCLFSPLLQEFFFLQYNTAASPRNCRRRRRLTFGDPIRPFSKMMERTRRIRKKELNRLECVCVVSTF